MTYHSENYFCESHPTGWTRDEQSNHRNHGKERTTEHIR